MIRDRKNGIQEMTKIFAIEIVKYSLHLKERKIDYSLRDQILRSGTSIGANVREAIASSSRREFLRFYEIALRSAHESDYWLEILDSVFESSETSKSLRENLLVIKKILATIILKLKKSNP